MDLQALRGSLNPVLPVKDLRYKAEFRKANPDYFDPSARSPLCALTASLGLSLVLSGLPSLLWGLPALTATLLSALGWAVGVGLWLLCLAAKNVFSRVFASSEREKHLYKE